MARGRKSGRDKVLIVSDYHDCNLRQAGEVERVHCQHAIDHLLTLEGAMVGAAKAV